MTSVVITRKANIISSIKSAIHVVFVSIKSRKLIYCSFDKRNDIMVLGFIKSSTRQKDKSYKEEIELIAENTDTRENLKKMLQFREHIAVMFWDGTEIP